MAANVRMAAVRVGSGRVKYSGGSGGSGGPCQAVQRFRSNILTVRKIIVSKNQIVVPSKMHFLKFRRIWASFVIPNN